MENIILILIGAILTYQIFILRKNYNKKLRTLESGIETLKNEIKGVCLGSAGVGKRLSKVEEFLVQLSYRQDTAELKEPDSQSYKQAAKMVAMGASIDELVKNCGISKAEAELVSMLYKNNELDQLTFREKKVI